VSLCFLWQYGVTGKRYKTEMVEDSSPVPKHNQANIDSITTCLV